MTFGKLMRKLGLVGLIVFYVGLLAFLALMTNWMFFWVFVIIGITVGVGEIANNFWGYGKTLSTEFKHTLQKLGKYRVYGYCALACLLLAIASLCVHLGVYW